MLTEELETILTDSLADFKLDQEEKYILRELSATLEVEQLSFIRNKSFELVRKYVEQGAVESTRALIWLEKVIKSIQKTPSRTAIEAQAFFSPGTDCRRKIISLIKNAKKQIKICVFTISDNNIRDAILEAYTRGIEIIIISDNDKSNDKGSDIHFMKEKGLTVLLDHSSAHMHHKFAIFDDQILLNGSFNWTRSATQANQENILVTGDLKLLSSFKHEFEQLQHQFSNKS